MILLRFYIFLISCFNKTFNKSEDCIQKSGCPPSLKNTMTFSNTEPLFPLADNGLELIRLSPVTQPRGSHLPQFLLILFKGLPGPYRLRGLEPLI